MLRFEEVEFRYPGRAAIVSGVSVAVAAGEVVALVGRSGAGKSTLLKLANRLLLPTGGRVLVDGRDTTAWDPIALRRRIGYVFQDIGLFPHMTVEQNVRIVPRLEGWDTTRAAARARELLDLVDLAPAAFAARYPHQLSGGQRQRVGVARALAVDPPVLLMDEPFGALDPITRADLRQAFTRLQRRLRTTVLLVTHDIAEAFSVADRVGVIDQGALIACDTPARIAASPDARIRALLAAVPTLPAGGA